MINFFYSGRSIINKKSDGSNVKESTDSSTTIEEDDVKGNITHFNYNRYTDLYNILSNMPKWLLFPKYLIFFSSIWLPFLSSPNHFSLHRTYFRENNGRICLTDLCSCHLWCLFYLLIFFSWLLTTLLLALFWLSFFFFFFCSPCAYCDVCNRLEEKSKGVVDRSSTVIAKEPEGMCLISALICFFLGFFLQISFPSLHFSHAKRNTPK